MSVVVAVEQVGSCRKQVTIEVPAPAVAAEIERVVKEYGRKARIPGFRAGKVPAEMVRRRFREDIDREVVERLVPRYWRQAQAESRIEALLPPRVGDVELRPGAPLTFVATVETRPEFALGAIGGFDLPEMEVEATGAEVESALADLRRGLADWVPVERPAAGGDRVEGRLLELTGDARPHPVEFVVGEPSVWPELSSAVEGLGAGQTAEFARPPAETAEAAEPAPGAVARERRYRLELGAVREERQPPLDDAFAARVGSFADLPALRQVVGARIAAGKRGERRRRREQAALDQLRQRHPFELPEGVVEHEQEQLLRDYADSLARRGVELERAQIDWQGLRREVRPQAERRVHARILLDTIAEREGVAVDEAEFEQALQAIARAEGRSTAAVRQDLDQAGRLGMLRAQLRRDKTLGRLLGEDQEADPAGSAGSD
jgi:trigger factor